MRSTRSAEHRVNESVSFISSIFVFFFLSLSLMAWSLALFVGADSSQRTCWRAPGWGPQFWGFSPVLLTGCSRCRPWSVSIWPCGSETRSSPAPRSVWVRARSASVRSGKGTFYSETPFRARAAARWWKLFVSSGSSPPSRRSAAPPASRFLVCSSGTGSHSCSRPRNFRSRCPRSCPPGRCTPRPPILGPASRRPSCTVWFRLQMWRRETSTLHESRVPQKGTITQCLTTLHTSHSLSLSVCLSGKVNSEETSCDTSRNTDWPHVRPYSCFFYASNCVLGNLIQPACLQKHFYESIVKMWLSVY